MPPDMGVYILALSNPDYVINTRPSLFAPKRPRRVLDKNMILPIYPVTLRAGSLGGMCP